MGATIGALNGRVFVELEAVADHLRADDVHRAVSQALTIRTQQTRQGSTNALLSVSSAFTPTTFDYDITSLIASGAPAWIEMQSELDSGYYPLRVVNKSELADFRRAGVMAAAFWAEESTTKTAAAVQYVSFSVIPNAQCRILFDRDLIADTLTSLSRLPSHVDDLIVKEAQNILIPQIKLRIAASLPRKEGQKETAGLVLSTLDGVYQQNLIQIRSLEQLWVVWAFRDRDADTSFTKPTPASRNAYGDGYTW